MIKGLWGGYLSTWPLPKWLQKKYPNAKQQGAKGVMPANPTGKTYIFVPACMFITILTCAGLWVALILQYQVMHKKTQFEPHTAIHLFEVKKGSVADLVERNHHDVATVSPFFDLIQNVRSMLDTYFFVAAVSVVIMIFRMFHYLDFQGKLNAITVTVRTGIGELFHLLVVLNFVNAGFAFLGFLLFGSQVSASISTVIDLSLCRWEGI